MADGEDQEHQERETIILLLDGLMVRGREDKERLPRLFPENEPRAGSGAGQGYEKGSLRTLFSYLSCEREGGGVRPFSICEGIERCSKRPIKACKMHQCNAKNTTLHSKKKKYTNMTHILLID